MENPPRRLADVRSDPTYPGKPTCCLAIKEDAIKLVPYLIHRARKLVEDPSCAHPRSEAIEKATREFEERAKKFTEGKAYSNTDTADKKLKEFCDQELAFCESFPGNMTDKEECVHIGDTLDNLQLINKCCCPKATNACHFKVGKLADMLKMHDLELWKFYVKGANKVGLLVTGLSFCSSCDAQ